jgi:hypothetical protein
MCPLWHKSCPQLVVASRGISSNWLIGSKHESLPRIWVMCKIKRQTASVKHSIYYLPPFLTLFFVVMIYYLLLLMLNCLFPIFFFLNQITNVFGPAFLLKLYVGGALTGSVFFLLEKAFLAYRKQVRTMMY